MVLLFSDGSDLEGIETAQDIKYMKIFENTLGFLCAWTARIVAKEDSKYLFPKKILLYIVLIFSFIICLLYLGKNIGVFEDFLSISHSFVTVVITVVGIGRLLILFDKGYEDLLIEFVHYIHLFNHKDRSEYAFSIHMTAHRFSHFFTVYINLCISIGVFGLNLLPIYKNLESGAYKNYKHGNITFLGSIDHVMPFDYHSSIYLYVLVLIYDIFLTTIYAYCFGIIDILIAVMVIHIWGHMRILIKDIENFPVPSEKITTIDENIQYVFFTNEEEEIVARDICSIVTWHARIAEFASNMMNTFGLTLVMYYVFHFFSGSIYMLHCFQMNLDAFVLYGPLTFFAFQQIILISYLFEILTTISDEYCSAIYTLPWECMHVDNRRKVYIMLNRAQKPLQVKAMSIVNVGVKSVATLIKTSISYYIMFKAFEEK